MEFSPANHIVQLCLRGMAIESSSNPEEASMIFMQAWNQASNDFEKYLAAYYFARQQINVADKLEWLQTAISLALNINDSAVTSAFSALYDDIAACYDQLNDSESAKKYFALADTFRGTPSDAGPFYHGTRADLHVGDLLTAGFNSNYQADLTMNHIYFTAVANGAGLAAALAKGEGRERVYTVEPTGDFENDPNVTNKKFPGNPTRSYRTTSPLKVVGELMDWKKQTTEDIRQWRDKLEKNKGEIINQPQV